MLARKKSKTFLSFLLVLVILVAVPGSALAYGENADWTRAPGCGNPAPGKPWLYSAKSAGAGAVDLYWTEVSGATSWTLAYGVKPGVYPYGIDRFGNNSSRSIRVSGLPSGTYYFALRANNDCMPGPFSSELSATVGKGGVSTAVLTPKTSQPVISKPGTTQITPTPILKLGPKGVEAVPSPSASKPAPPVKKGFFQNLLDLFFGFFK